MEGACRLTVSEAWLLWSGLALTGIVPLCREWGSGLRGVIERLSRRRASSNARRESMPSWPQRMQPALAVRPETASDRSVRPLKNKNPAGSRRYGVFFYYADCLTDYCLTDHCLTDYFCWCPREDSNLHTLRRMDLNHVRLPIPPPGPTDTAKSAILANDSNLSMAA